MFTTAQLDRWQKFFNVMWNRHVVERQPLGFTTTIGELGEVLVHCNYLSGCAVGCNLSPADLEAVKPYDMGYGVADLFGTPITLLSINRDDLPFLREAQTCHDYAATYQYVKVCFDWNDKPCFQVLYDAKKKGRNAVVESNYRKLAKAFNLTIPS